MHYRDRSLLRRAPLGAQVNQVWPGGQAGGAKVHRAVPHERQASGSDQPMGAQAQGARGLGKACVALANNSARVLSSVTTREQGYHVLESRGNLRRRVRPRLRAVPYAYGIRLAEPSMTQPFLSADPTADQLRALVKYLSTFRDGSGNIREDDPETSTRADSRQIERSLAELFGVKPPESKSYYDFAVEINKGGGVVISAASVKSKELERLRDFGDSKARKKLRAYLEIANASAKDWRLCQQMGLSEDHFRQHKHPAEFGEAILQRQSNERALAEAKIQQQRRHSAHRVVDQKASVFLSVMYSPMDKEHQRDYLVSSFPIVLPGPVSWEFRSKALVGLDQHACVIYEWYALSGSQFKYYPLVTDRRYGSRLFQLLKPAQESLHQRAVRMFGHS